MGGWPSAGQKEHKLLEPPPNKKKEKRDILVTTVSRNPVILHSSSVLHDHDIYPTGVDRYAFLPPLRYEYLLFVQHEQGWWGISFLHSSFIIFTIHLSREFAEILCLYQPVRSIDVRNRQSI